MTPAERFWSKVDRNGGYPDFSDPLVRLDHGDGECWIWTAGTSRDGYGIFKTGGRSGPVVGAHRWSKNVQPGTPPLDHLCRRRACVRPNHLEAVTSRENTFRGATPARINSEKSSCPQGHAYEGWNLIELYGRRYCRACIYARRAASRARQKELAA